MLPRAVSVSPCMATGQGAVLISTVAPGGPPAGPVKVACCRLLTGPLPAINRIWPVPAPRALPVRTEVRTRETPANFVCNSGQGGCTWPTMSSVLRPTVVVQRLERFATTSLTSPYQFRPCSSTLQWHLHSASSPHQISPVYGSGETIEAISDAAVAPGWLALV